MHIKRDALIILAAAFLAALTVNAFSPRGIPLFNRGSKPAGADKAIQESGLSSEDGIFFVDTPWARDFVERKLGVILDARSEDQYNQDHLPGALNCDFQKLETCLPSLLGAVGFQVPLMVYCNGRHCEYSKMLADNLWEIGYRRLYVYEAGFSEWIENGLPLSKESNQSLMSPQNKPALSRLLDLGQKIPAAVWLGADILLLVWGIWIVFFLRRGKGDSLAAGLGLKLVGLLFMAASLHKLVSPQEFSHILDNYRILPPILVNPFAVIMPWIELFCGICLLTGLLRPASAALVLALTAVFMLAVGFNLARGLDFDCGCFGSGHTHPLEILLRDAGIFLIALSGVAGAKKKRTGP